MRQTARMLGRLYDAVECVGLAPDLVAQLRHEAGVPVFAGISSAAHPTAALGARLGDGVTPAEARHLMLLAVLASTIG
jgi:ornithine carbamoyltransferase